MGNSLMKVSYETVDHPSDEEWDWIEKNLTVRQEKLVYIDKPDMDNNPHMPERLRELFDRLAKEGDGWGFDIHIG